jgi:hypothetical protein
LQENPLISNIITTSKVTLFKVNAKSTLKRDSLQIKTYFIILYQVGSVLIIPTFSRGTPPPSSREGLGPVKQNPFFPNRKKGPKSTNSATLNCEL